MPLNKSSVRISDSITTIHNDKNILWPSRHLLLIFKITLILAYSNMSLLARTFKVTVLLSQARIQINVSCSGQIKFFCKIPVRARISQHAPNVKNYNIFRHKGQTNTRARPTQGPDQPMDSLRLQLEV